MYSDELSEPLLLSGIQHFAFCRRQWALIHIEQQWAENLRTVEGNLFHRRAHEEDSVEARGDRIIMRGLRITSRELNISGSCDVVEFHRDPNGISLNGYDGKWRVYPIEYKKGSPKANAADELQLCGQAMALEEMLSCSIPKGSLFYGETRRRLEVNFTEELRSEVRSMLAEMRSYYERGYTPFVKPHKGCSACSLKEICLPALQKSPKVSDYLNRHMKEADECENC